MILIALQNKGDLPEFITVYLKFGVSDANASLIIETLIKKKGFSFFKKIINTKQLSKHKKSF